MEKHMAESPELPKKPDDSRSRHEAKLEAAVVKQSVDKSINKSTLDDIGRVANHALLEQLIPHNLKALIGSAVGIVAGKLMNDKAGDLFGTGPNPNKKLPNDPPPEPSNR